MPFNPAKFKECAQRYISDPSIKRQLSAICNRYEEAREPTKKIEIMRELTELMDKKLNEAERNSLMQNCNCLSDSTVAEGIKILKESSDINQFIARLNNAELGTGEMELSGKTIKVIYNNCRCPSMGRYGKPFSTTFCNCSRGWLEAFFERVLNQKIKVEMVDTIMHGAKHCSFTVELEKLF